MTVPAENVHHGDGVRQHLQKDVLSKPDLRIITPQEIVTHFNAHWEETSITQGVVPDGWHGAVTPDGERRSGHIVLLPQLIELAGTQVRTLDFVQFLQQEDFSLQHYGEPVGTGEAVSALDSREIPRNGLPVFRAVRGVDRRGKPPMEISVWNGIDCQSAERITEIGNMPKGQKTDVDRQVYVEAFNELLRPFIGSGTTQSRVRLGLGSGTVSQWRIFDDCAAGNTSTFGAKEVALKRNNKFQGVFLVDGMGISTLQAIIGDIWWANNRGNRALGHLVTCGTISRGLGGPNEGTMYMVNTTQHLLERGKLTSGDIGDNTDTEECKQQQPHIIHPGNGSQNYEEYIFLRGGWFVLKTREARFQERGKPHNGQVMVSSASRIDDSPLLAAGSRPTQWGVVINYPH